ncbi:hypothetical protein DFH09DRAFT_1320511 [Mycena vulgaris]|nr:hypothetical protein DFH09DRAFT_1320511 [Mycena vulgaris]
MAVPVVRLLPKQNFLQAGLEALLQIKKDPGIPSLKDPLSVVEMALEAEVERSHAIEALTARDAAIERLSDAYLSLRQKITIIERLQQAPKNKSSSGTVNEQVSALETTVKNLREQLTIATSLNVPLRCVEPPPSYNENGIDHANPGHNPQLVRPASRAPLRVPRETPPPTCPSTSSDNNARHILNDNDLDYQAQAAPKPESFTPPPFKVVHTAPKSSEPEDIIKARHALLAKIPLPLDPPDDTLKPIVIPPPFTLHEFLANALFETQLTTSWCPEREEHGYLLTPLFKCNTNPLVATAHRWNMVDVDVMARMSKPTECFYNNDGNWYYAGVYRAFRLEDLTTKEWEALSAETTQALVRDTIAARKNTSPQNIYETAQLYAAGASRVSDCMCVRGEVEGHVLNMDVVQSGMAKEER